MIARFPGRNLGVVVDNVDPKKLGRIRVKVPEVLSDTETGWCLPASPFAGPNIGFHAVPPVGGLVFVEWPNGDLARVPIWCGATWSDGKGVPDVDHETIALVTAAGHRIELSDKSGSEAVKITAKSGAKVVLDSNGIKLEYSGQKVVLDSSGVSINDGALTVKS